MYDGLNIRTELDYVLGRKSTNPVNQSGKSLIKTSVDLMGLVAAGAAVGLTTVVVGAGAGPGGFMSGWITVMAQFILTTANLSHDRRPRVAGPGVSATYH